MEQDQSHFEQVVQVRDVVDKILLRQEAVIAAIHKLASIIDTTNALVAEMAIAANNQPSVG